MTITPVSFEKDFNICFKSKSAKKLSAKLRNLMIIYQENLYYAQDLQKRTYDKGVKPRSYAPGKRFS